MKHYDLGELIEMSQGNSEFVNKMVKVFLDSTGEALDEMLILFKQKDLLGVAGLAHKIKPSIELMGIVSLIDVVRVIEVNGKGDGADLEILLPELEKGLHVVFEELREDFQ
jgi:HPt (histidine-containing phosphotransfer) domain-containing protein